MSPLLFDGGSILNRLQYLKVKKRLLYWLHWRLRQPENRMNSDLFLSHSQDFSYPNNLFPFTFAGFLKSQQFISLHIHKICHFSTTFFLLARQFSYWQGISHYFLPLHIRRISQISTIYFLPHSQDFSYLINLFPFTFAGFPISQQFISLHICKIYHISTTYFLAHAHSQDLSYLNNLFPVAFAWFIKNSFSS